MLILRPAAEQDLSDIVQLAQLLDSVNLPSNPEYIRGEIARSQESFAARYTNWRKGIYFFVLHDTETQKCVGASMIIAKHGQPGAPHFWLEVSTEERKSQDLGKRFVHTKLRLRSSEDGPTEIGGLILHPDYRHHPQRCGKALSIVRFAYMSLHPDRFEREVIAEMLSPLDEQGKNLLWDAFGKRFTGLAFREADHLSATNKQFIIDLFPRDPVYVTLFPDEVQKTIGEPNPTAKPAVRILEKIGFKPLNQVDPFDGGPYYGAARDAIVPVNERRELILPQAPSSEATTAANAALTLIAAEKDHDFRATVVAMDQDASPIVTLECRKLLGLETGDRIHVFPLP